MYALLPIFVSSLFLLCGIHVLTTRWQTRAGRVFFCLTVLIGVWQGLWAFLFQANDVDTAQMLAKAGWVAILILPTALYHFATEVAECREEQRWLTAAYALDAVLIALLLCSELVIAGVRHFHFGFYPKAGPFEAVHIAQTIAVVSRSMWLLYVGQKNATAERRKRLRTCLFGVGLISLSAVDYATNYGVAIYPPGVFPLAIAPGTIAVGIIMFDLMRPYALAATVAHEVRTPLTTIRLQAAEIARAWPELFHGYRLAVEHGLCQPPTHQGMLERVSKLAGTISSEVASAHGVIDMALASVTLEQLDRRSFTRHSLRECVDTALAQYPFQSGERERVEIHNIRPDWYFNGSDTLLVYVLFNLLKNALHAIQIARKGHIEIACRQTEDSYILELRDSATGIPPTIQRRIFDPFFSTKQHGKGSGVGLTFCRRVMQAFDGSIQCESVVGEYALFSMRFPKGSSV